MSYEYNNTIFGQAEVDFAPQQTPTGTDSVLGRDAFLQLLITQLKNQDPLNPMEDKEFTAQLAQFSSLEKLEQISASLDTMNESEGRQDMLSAVSFIGKQVRAGGDTLSKQGGQVSTMYYSIDDPAASVLVNVFDANGNLVQTLSQGGRQAGSYEFTWDGRDYTGRAVEDGVYTVRMAVEGPDGEPVLAETDVSGEVSGISTRDGQTYLRLKDGREVSLFDIIEVVNPQADTGAGTDPIGG